MAFDQANYLFVLGRFEPDTGVAAGAAIALLGRARGFTLAFGLAFALGSAAAALGRKGLQGSPTARALDMFGIKFMFGWILFIPPYLERASNAKESVALSCCTIHAVWLQKLTEHDVKQKMNCVLTYV